MPKVLPALVLAAAAAAAPATARAGWLLEASIGDAWQVSDARRVPITLMLTPGASVFDGLLRVELGVAASLGDVPGTQPDLELRPMLVLSPPAFPLYLRGIAAFRDLLNGPASWALGGGVGASFSVLGAGLFLEAAALPRTVNGATELSVEGRLGIFTEF